MYHLELPYNSSHRCVYRRLLAYMKYIKMFRRRIEKTDIKWVPVESMLDGTVRLRPVFQTTFGRWWAREGAALVRKAQIVSDPSRCVPAACSHLEALPLRQILTESGPSIWGTTPRPTASTFSRKAPWGPPLATRTPPSPTL